MDYISAPKLSLRGEFDETCIFASQYHLVTCSSVCYRYVSDHYWYLTKCNSMLFMNGNIEFY